MDLYKVDVNNLITDDLDGINANTDVLESLFATEGQPWDGGE